MSGEATPNADGADAIGSGRFKRVVILACEGLGVGGGDASKGAHRGAATLNHLADYLGGVELPFLQWLGLGNLLQTSAKGLEPAAPPAASVARMHPSRPTTDRDLLFAEAVGDMLPAALEAGVEVVAIGDAIALAGDGRTSKTVDANAMESVFDAIGEAFGSIDRGIVLATIGPEGEETLGGAGPVGLARRLARLDESLPRALDLLGEDGLLVLLGLNGADSTLAVTGGPTEERVPMLAFTPLVPSGITLGDDRRLADLAKTLAENFGLSLDGPGQSFYRPLLS